MTWNKALSIPYQGCEQHERGDLLSSETLDLGDVLVPAGSVGESSLVGALGQGVEDLSVLVRDLVTIVGYEKRNIGWLSWV